MNKKDVDSIAWLIKQAKEKNQPKPIVFLGAGASISAGIPGTKTIIEDILKNFANKPEVKQLDDESRKDYYKIMTCLNTSERHTLLRNYIISEDVKINVTHIYLAQMLNEGYIDYVLTVNFDDLFLRACSLFNFIPPVYDISILKDFTTTTLIERSLTYLHGQHHGFWLLNTGEELEKVKEYIRTVFDRICNNRTWIIIGYSGEDTVFDEIARLDNFTNELFWIGYNDHLPSKKVQDRLLNKPNSNASLVSGYNADSFLLKLHSELGMRTPDIFNKPFSFLKGLIDNIRDISDILIKGEHEILFKNVKERFDVALKQANAAIKLYEESDPSGALSTQDINRDQIKKEIIETIIKGNFEISDQILEKADLKDQEIKTLLSRLFHNWGLQLAGLSKSGQSNNKEGHLEAIKKFGIAHELNPTDPYIVNNWGASLAEVAKQEQSELLFINAIEKYNLSISLEENNSIAYSNLGNSLSNLAKLRRDEHLFLDAISMQERATSLNPQFGNAYNNWAYTLLCMARFVPQERVENYVRQALDKAEKAVMFDESAYNLSCCYALLGQKQNALNYLSIVLKNKEITIEEVQSDEDWYGFQDDIEFHSLIQHHKEKSISSATS